VGKLNTTQSISGSTNHCERKRKQHVATMPQHTKYRRNSSKKINRQRDGLPGCGAGLGVRYICGKRGRGVGLLVWAGKRTHPTDLVTHTVLKATPRGSGSVQQTSFQQEQLLMGSNSFKSHHDFLQTHSQILALVAKSLLSWAGSVSSSEFKSFGDCQSCLLNWGRLWLSQPSSGRFLASLGYLCKTPMSAILEALTANFGDGCVKKVVMKRTPMMRTRTRTRTWIAVRKLVSKGMAGKKTRAKRNICGKGWWSADVG
jgi:hypothetical protein